MWGARRAWKGRALEHIGESKPENEALRDCLAAPSAAVVEALIDTSPVGVVVFDARGGEPVSLNLAARRIVEGLRAPGRSAEQALEAARCRRADGRETALGELGRAAPLRAEEVLLLAPDGRSVKALVNATPIRAEAEEMESVVVTLQDLTPLEDLERLRAEFLGMVSHGLRGPLTFIKGSAATVLGAPANLDRTEMLQFFRIIDEQADYMRGLISDLLDAGCIDAGTLSVTAQPSEARDLVDQARNTFLSGGSRHTVVIDLPPDLPRMMADRRRVVQVLNNLLANAARRSPVSSPIRVAAARDGTHVAISVSDEGPGVPPELLPRLFQKHAGGGNGEGLGLVICKGLVEAHGGRIWAASGGPGQDTRFTFTLPVAEGEPAGPPQGRSRSPRECEPTPVLVVDDDPQVLHYVRDVLANAGYSPIVTTDHRELSRIIDAEQPRLVLLDLILPGADGIELMESVPELADVPVIFISGYGRDETIARVLEAGAADYIFKPFSPTELTARVRAALRRRMEPEPFVLEDLAIHYEQRRVTVGGRPVRLTATEYELLRVLSDNAGRVSTYDALIHQVWRGQDAVAPDLVRTFVKKLRQKLGDDAARPTYIFNEHGVGYRMATPARADA